MRRSSGRAVFGIKGTPYLILDLIPEEGTAHIAHSQKTLTDEASFYIMKIDRG
jgi:hypothetical protein